MKKVGILGGMGPDATVLLMKKVIDSLNVEDDCDHIPMIVHQNTQVPSRIKRILEGGHEDPGPVLIKMAKDLAYMKCDFLAMPCNTAHYYYSDICKSVSVPLLNMIELSAQKLYNLKFKKVGILASPAVKEIGIFDKSFRKFGLDGQFCPDDMKMLGIIKSIKKGDLGKQTIQDFQSQIETFEEKNCDCILIACTEFSFLRDKVQNSLECLDSLDCLASNIIQTANRIDELL